MRRVQSLQCFRNVFIFVESISGQRPVDCGGIGSGRSGVYTIYPKGSADPLKVFFFFSFFFLFIFQ